MRLLDDLATLSPGENGAARGKLRSRSRPRCYGPATRENREVDPKRDGAVPVPS